MSGGDRVFFPGTDYLAQIAEGGWVAVDKDSSAVVLGIDGKPVPVMITDELDAGVVAEVSTGRILQIIIHQYT